ATFPPVLAVQLRGARRRFVGLRRGTRRRVVGRRPGAACPDAARAHRDGDDDAHDHGVVPYRAVVEDVDDQEREHRHDRGPIHPRVPDPVPAQHCIPLDALGHEATIPPPPVAVNGPSLWSWTRSPTGHESAGLDCEVADSFSALDARWRACCSFRLEGRAARPTAALLLSTRCDGSPSASSQAALSTSTGGSGTLGQSGTWRKANPRPARPPALVAHCGAGGADGPSI